MTPRRVNDFCEKKVEKVEEKLKEDRGIIHIRDLQWEMAKNRHKGKWFLRGWRSFGYFIILVRTAKPRLPAHNII